MTAKQLVDVPTGHAANGIDPTAWGSLLTFPDFSAIGDSAIWIMGVTIAVVASLETLLCVEATDKLDPEKRVTPNQQRVVGPRGRKHRERIDWWVAHHASDCTLLGEHPNRQRHQDERHSARGVVDGVLPPRPHAC